MKKIVILLLILLVGFGVYWYFNREKKSGPREPKAAALVVAKNSPGFNQGIDSLLDTYFTIKEAFVDADTAKAKAATRQLISMTDSSRLVELKKDPSGIYESAATQLNDVKLNAESLLNQKDITEMRQDFRMVGESMYPLLKTIGYEGKKLYWQNCPMAFGEDKGANWISNTTEIVNPYLGKNHPEFKGTMLHCGEVKDSIVAH
ncbi:MAG: DUF3347 domain-containing protein [Ferruginibacter sp.]